MNWRMKYTYNDNNKGNALYLDIIKVQFHLDLVKPQEIDQAGNIILISTYSI